MVSNYDMDTFFSSSTLNEEALRVKPKIWLEHLKPKGYRRPSMMTYYHNLENFDGLKTIGTQYSFIKHYELFGAYCLQKEQGLNKQANASIRAFVSYSKTRSIRFQRRIAEELSSLAYRNPDTHALLAFPLTEYLKAILEAWRLEDMCNPTPLKWLGYISGDTHFYERALTLDPEDELCISELARAIIRDIDFQTHHLSESSFLGELSDAYASLEKAKNLISSLRNNEIKSGIEIQLHHLDALLTCWEAYLKTGSDVPFPLWCESQGENVNLCSAFYYKK